MNLTAETSVICQGCENECEVSVAFVGGMPVCLGGNNCPTGECFALAQARKFPQQDKPASQSAKTPQK